MSENVASMMGRLERPGRVDCTDHLSVVLDRGAGDLAVLSFGGALVRGNAAQVDRAVGSVFATSSRMVVIDLGGVTLLDATALAGVTRQANDARRRGTNVTILPPEPRIYDLPVAS